MRVRFEQTTGRSPRSDIRPRRTGPGAQLLLVGAAAMWLVSCGPESPAPAEPTTAPPAPTGICRAFLYPGDTGGARIQNAVNDTKCDTVSIDSVGPDTSGTWVVAQDIVLRSNLVLDSSGATPAVLTAAGGNLRVGLMRIEGRSNITMRRLSLQGGNKAPNGIWIAGSRDITVSQGTVSGALYHAVHIASTPSSNITISEVTLEDNGLIGVRSDTANLSSYHSRVLVTNSSMTASGYGVALANCGSSPQTACEIRNNVIARVSESGMDLNRSPYAIVSGNDVSTCVNGITVDDVRDSTISQNTIRGCTAYGILLANGAAPANRPWLLSGNQISGNTVSNSGLYGLASYGSLTDPNDRNDSNAWTNNRIDANRAGGCVANVVSNTFSGNGPQDCRPQRGLIQTTRTYLGGRERGLPTIDAQRNSSVRRDRTSSRTELRHTLHSRRDRRCAGRLGGRADRRCLPAESGSDPRRRAHARRR